MDPVHCQARIFANPAKPARFEMRTTSKHYLPGLPRW